MTVIIGIDPGSRITGYGIIEHLGDRYTYRASGCIRMTIAADLLVRLQQIANGLTEIISHHLPEVMAIEDIFVHRNPRSAIKLGQARGAAIVTAGQFNLQLAEYSPRQVKQAVVGHGGASKEQVQHMVKVLLNLPSAPQSDAADALAIALCHAHSHGRLISQVTKRRRRRFTLSSLA